MPSKTRFTALFLLALAGCNPDRIDHGRDAGLPDMSWPNTGGDGGCFGASCDGGADAGLPQGADAGQDAGFDAGTADAGFDAGLGNLEIYVRGDLTPRSFSDGLAGQTPKRQTFSIARFDLMRSATDSSPVTAFDHGPVGAAIDMVSGARALAGRSDGTQLPAGTFTHGRVLMSQAEVTVNATLHQGALHVPGDLTVLTALSDTLVGGQSWSQGRTEYRFAAFGHSLTLGGLSPSLPTTSGGNIVREGGRTWLVFPFSSPFVLDPASPTPQSATIVYEVYESFRWADQADAGYNAPNVFDVDGNTLRYEPVYNFGATGYRTERP